MDDALVIELSDYRCFAQSSPCRIEIDDGFTALVGPNNSGKSSFLRSFFELRNLYGLLSSHLIPLLAGTAVDAQLLGVHDQTEVFFDDSARSLTVALNFRDPRGDREITAATLRCDRGRGWSLATKWPAHLAAPAGWSGHLSGPKAVATNGEHWDVAPLLNWARAFANSMYIGAYRDLASKSSGPYFDLHIGSDFVSRWHVWKTGKSREDQSAALRVERDVRRIFGLRQLTIDANPGDSTLQITTDRGARKLSEVGSGLAQFIVVFACAAMRKPEFIMIDEPEVHLHPSLQATFVTSLASYATRGVVFATHSIGLARTIADRIYAFSVDDHATSHVQRLGEVKNLTEFLGEMSFSAYQELGFEKLLLVEGPSEVRTVQEWLRKFGKDQRVVIMNLGGSGMISRRRSNELAELKRITTKIAVLIDSERGSESAPLDPVRLAFVADCEGLGFQVCVTERRATENYFTQSAISLAKRSEKYLALGKFGKLEGPLAWSKMGDNWRIASHMSKDDLADSDVGRFLEGL